MICSLVSNWYVPCCVTWCGIAVHVVCASDGTWSGLGVYFAIFLVCICCVRGMGQLTDFRWPGGLDPFPSPSLEEAECRASIARLALRHGSE